MNWEAQLQAYAQRYLTEGTGWRLIRARAVRFHLEPPREIAEDALQEALLNVWRAYRENEGCFADYQDYRRMVTRAAFNVLNSQARRKFRVALGLDAAPIAGRNPSDPRLEALRACLESLPEEVREIVESYFYEDLTLNELAERFLPGDTREAGAQRSAINRRLRRTLSLVRQLLLARHTDLYWPEEFPPVE